MGRVLCVAAGLVLAAAARADERPGLPSAEHEQLGQRISLDIPSQPLTTALERYGDATGREILYNSNLAIGLRSAAVKGSMASDEALRLLLDGTGLFARYINSTSFILEPAPAAASSTAAAATPPPQFRYYYGRIQASVREVLCRNQDARPGGYRIAARFWIGSTGRVSRYERLSSTGRDGVDQGVDRVLQGLSFGEAPPSGFAQPVTVVVVPQASGVTLGCDNASPGSRTSKVGP